MFIFERMTEWPIREREPAWPFDVVAIGASLGGPKAIRELFRELPVAFPPAVLVVQHRRVDAGLDRLLQRCTTMPVHLARDGAALERGRVYVVPAGTRVKVTQAHCLSVVTEASPSFGCPSIDALFQSVARVCGPRAIGVVLTGRLTDGAKGASAIKTAGGRMLVQDPEDAFACEMPNATMATGCVDFVLPLDAIAPTLTSLVMQPGSAELFRVALPSWARCAALSE
jgi:two-component system chemotaxis response regulator CheB